MTPYSLDASLHHFLFVFIREITLRQLVTNAHHAGAHARERLHLLLDVRADLVAVESRPFLQRKVKVTTIQVVHFESARSKLFQLVFLANLSNTTTLFVAGSNTIS